MQCCVFEGFVSKMEWICPAKKTPQLSSQIGMQSFLLETLNKLPYLSFLNFIS